MSEMSWHAAVEWLRAQPDQEELVKACFFDDPLLAAAERFYDSGEYRASRAFMPSVPGRALDVGAGRGILSYALARDGWSVVSLEPDPSPLVGHQAIRTLADVSGLRFQIVNGLGENLPSETASLDLVFCRQVLHHIRDLSGFCAQVFRVLKPGGVMIATREHVLSRDADLPAFLASHPLHHLYGGEHAYTLATYINCIEGAGLTLTKVLRPFDSEINYFPMTREHLNSYIARALRLPRCATALIPDWLVRYIGARSNAPGRLYSFVARKPV